MRTKSVDKARKILLKMLPEDGTPIGNMKIAEEFKQEHISKWDLRLAKRELLEKGAIGKAGGQGGSIFRMATEIVKKKRPSAQDENYIKKLLLKSLPKDGSRKSNREVIAEMKREGITEEDYWTIRNQLIEKGQIAKGAGQGGSVYKLIDTSKSKQKAKRSHKFRKERDLYNPFYKAIKEYWIKDNELDGKKCVVSITADQGHRLKKGKWTIPDITIVTVRMFAYVPGKTLDIITFEIKPANDLDVRGVFETASHSRFAHKSFLAVHLPDGPPEKDIEFNRLLKECERFGIGFMYFVRPDDWATYETIVEPKRNIPAPEDVNAFIGNQLDKKDQNEILELLK